MNRTAKNDPFSKQSQFRALIENIQNNYISEKGWPSEWFLDKWPHITMFEYENLNLTDAVKRTEQEWEERHQTSFPWHFWHGIRSSRNFHSSQVIALTLLGAFMGNSTNIQR